ncbi:hypothetical protein [Streptomyces sp. TE33382]
MLMVGLLAGCSSIMTDDPESTDPVAAVEELPPDDDEADSRKDAAEFRKAMHENGDAYQLLPAVDRIIGDWDSDEARAFISTKLPAALSTSENGEFLAGAFAKWQKSESGKASVSVYGGNGKLIFTGTF